MKTNLLLLALLFVSPLLLNAQNKPEEGKDWIKPAIREGLCLSNLFQSNMVLQRDKPVKIWGWAAPGEEITVTFANQTQKVKADKDRLWKVTLTAMEANASSQALTVKGSKTLILENILIGDVWILGGQSNMEFSIGQVEGGKLEIDSANFKNIRHMTMPRKSVQEYQKSFEITYKWDGRNKTHNKTDKGYWEICTPETARNLSAIGYIFARRIHMASQIPIGVIDTSVGGSTIESWTPFAAVKKAEGPVIKQWTAEQVKYIAEYDPKKELEERIAKKKAWIAMRTKQGKTPRPVNQILPTDLRPPRIRAGNLYGGMIAPLAGFSAKGILWHQGYNNCFEGSLGAARYYELFPTMIKSWRTAFNDPELAFGIISLCSADNQTADNFLEKTLDTGAYIREAQYKTFLKLRKAGDKNIGFASSYDQRRSWYHPQLKIPVGERIASWALSTQYGFSKLSWEPAYLEEMKAEDGKITLTFKESMATTPEGPITGFVIAGEDGRFQKANAEFLETKDKNGKVRKDTRRVILSSSLIKNPLHFRYAWARNPHANLVNRSKLPLGTQRSDSWTLTDMFKHYTGKTPTNEFDKLERNESGELKAALKAADLERRLHEARELLKKYEKSSANLR